jgi:guanylate kinase
MRAREVDGRDYHFLTMDEFRDKVERGEFIEHAHVHGNMYGTLRAPIRRALEAGRIYLLEIDVQGALQMKAQKIPGLYIFIAPPDFEELRRRLVGRATESPEVIERRLAKAADEYRERVSYDHVVVNDDLERCLREVRALIVLDKGPEVES